MDTNKTAQKPMDDFENPATGEVFGGSYPQLKLEQGAVSPLLVYLKSHEIEMNDLNKPGQKQTKAIGLATDPDGLIVSLPIGTVFENNMEEAQIKPGDSFKIKRYADQKHKTNGKEMKIFAVKVYARASV